MDLMEIKMTETLREQLSGAYTSQISGSLTKNPYNNYMINLMIPCGPENVEKLIAAAFGEIQKIKDKGPSQEDLQKVKEAFSKQHQENLKDNSYWISVLQRSVEQSTSPLNVLTVEKRLNDITSKELQERAKKYFNMNNYFQAVLYPEK